MWPARFGPSTTASFGTSTHSPSDPHAIVPLPGIPIGIVDALCIAAVAARSLAAVQTLIPTVQLGVLMIMSSSTAGCKDQ
jgi:hypothetical protein